MPPTAFAATYRVVIKDGIHARVRPACDVSNAAGGKVVFKNNTDFDVKVYLPGMVFSTGNASDNTLKKKPFKVTVGADSEEPVFISTHGDAQKGLFSYKVWCEQTNSFAEGNSDPEFIIEN